jgi:hypothetical protein
LAPYSQCEYCHFYTLHCNPFRPPIASSLDELH